jgi:hypothetical protein
VSVLAAIRPDTTTAIVLRGTLALAGTRTFACWRRRIKPALVFRAVSSQICPAPPRYRYIGEQPVQLATMTSDPQRESQMASYLRGLSPRAACRDRRRSLMPTAYKITAAQRRQIDADIAKAKPARTTANIRTDLAAAEAELPVWHDKFGRYSGNNPNKFTSQIRIAAATVRRLQMELAIAEKI